MRTLFCLILMLLYSALPALARAPVEVPFGDAPTMGPADAPVVMVEFIDFQ